MIPMQGGPGIFMRLPQQGKAAATGGGIITRRRFPYQEPDRDKNKRAIFSFHYIMN
jgi:hypothetical protein